MRGFGGKSESSDLNNVHFLACNFLFFLLNFFCSLSLSPPISQPLLQRHKPTLQAQNVYLFVLFDCFSFDLDWYSSCFFLLLLFSFIFECLVGRRMVMPISMSRQHAVNYVNAVHHVMHQHYVYRVADLKSCHAVNAPKNQPMKKRRPKYRHRFYMKVKRKPPPPLIHAGND